MRHILIVPLLAWNLQIASAQQIIWGQQQEIGTTGEEALRPRIEVNANGPMVLWGSPSTGLYFTTDLGTGFVSSIAIAPAGVLPWATSWAGGDIAAHGDTIIAVYSTGTQGVGTLYASRSVDGGSSWPDTMRIAPMPGLEARFPTVAYIPEQGPVVQYMEFDPGWSEPRYVVATSNDGGDTYGPPVPVSAPYAPGEVCDCCTGQMVQGNSAAIALYRNNGDNVRTMWAAVSNDGGDTFPIGGEIDQTGWVYNACSSSGPDGYVVGDSIRYVWMSGATNGTKVYYGSAALNDLTVGANALVHDGQQNGLQQNFPRIAGHGDTLGIVWEQNRLGDRNILFRWSVSGWAGLSEPDTIHTVVDGSQQTPDLAFANGVFHLVWEEQATGTLNYRSATIDNDSGINASEKGPRLNLWPNPVEEAVQMVPPTGTWSIVIIDAMGREVMRSAVSRSVPTNKLRSGSYTLRCLARDGGLLGQARFVK